MPKLRLLVPWFLCSALALGLGARASAGEPFRLRSNDFTDGARLPDAQLYSGFGYQGENISPHLVWSGAPAGTKSFVVTLYDPDAPTGSGWWHWLVIDIPATTRELPRGCGNGTAQLPAGAVQTRTDFGKPGYGGAAPPPGPPHHYIFTVYALKVDHLDVTPDSSPAMVGFMVHMNAIGQAKLTAIYGKR
jgi:Raf kinase inhibitor-like YbhB/YbcL family protein